MDKSTELLCKLQDPALRRVWLLYKALECVPLDRAIDLAGMADQFFVGSPSEARIEAPRLGLAKSPQLQTAVQTPSSDLRPKNPASDRISATDGRSKLPLSPEQRERLLGRLTEGARNAQLATEFGLSPRQVQGIRISQARVRKRGQAKEPFSPQNPPEPIEEVVRFLRQQDDVVVRRNDGEFLVNGRFRLNAAQLVERANRMRARHGKPAFRQGSSNPILDQFPEPKPQPVFWDDAPAGQQNGGAPP